MNFILLISSCIKLFLYYKHGLIKIAYIILINIITNLDILFLEFEKKKGTESGKIENLQEEQKRNKLNNSRPNVHEELNALTSSKYNKSCIPSTSKVIPSTNNDDFDTDVTKKRHYDEFFGDISDMLDTNDLGIPYMIYISYKLKHYYMYILYIYI